MKKLLGCVLFVSISFLSFSENFCSHGFWIDAVNKVLDSNNSAQSIKELREFIEQSPLLLNSKDLLGDTVLHGAIKSGDKFLICFLLEKQFLDKFDVDTQNNFGYRVLDLALNAYYDWVCEYSRDAQIEKTFWFLVISKLVIRGANWSLKNHHLSTPMHFVIENKLSEIKDLFMSSVNNEDVLLDRLKVLDINGKAPIDLDPELLEFCCKIHMEAKKKNIIEVERRLYSLLSLHG